VAKIATFLLILCFAAGLIAGSTPMIGIFTFALSCSMAFTVAVLQAITMAFTPLAMSCSAMRLTRSIMNSTDFSP